MTSEPDSNRRRPPTIDLTAKEVETAPDEATATASSNGQQGGPGSSSPFSARALPYAVGAAVGAVVVAAIVAGVWALGWVPAREVPREAAAPNVPVASSAPIASNAKIADDDLSSRLEKIEQSLKTPRTDEAMVGRVTAAEAQVQAQTRALADQLAALSRRVDEVAASSQAALAQAKAATAAVDGAKNATQSAAQRSDLDALGNRIAALDSAIKSLGSELTQRTSSADDRAARATVAAEALRAAVERGVPYQAELATVKLFGADPDAIAALEPFAADGLPSAILLGRELSGLTPALQKASGAASSEGSFLGRLEAHAQNLIRFTPVDAPRGNDPSSVVARINIEAAHGDIPAALADIARLPEGARSLADGWVKKAQAREAALGASRRIAADALAALNRPASQ
jgi:hypothetical protein